MEDFCKRIDIMFIQGDIVDVTFELPNMPRESVSKVLVNAKGLGLSIECPYADYAGGYVFRLESETTFSLPTVIASYDLVVELADGNYMTMIHEALFAVLKRRNCMGGEADDGSGESSE